MSDELHVMPNDGKHQESRDCFCEPKLDHVDEETGREVWLHKSPEELCQ